MALMTASTPTDPPATAAEVLRIAAEKLRARGQQREEIAGDDGPECDGECETSDCHTVSAVATWHRAAALVDSMAADLPDAVRLTPEPRLPALKPVADMTEDELRDTLQRRLDLARRLFEAQFELCGGRKPGDPTWGELEPSEHDDYLAQAGEAEHVFRAELERVRRDLETQTAERDEDRQAATDEANAYGIRRRRSEEQAELLDEILRHFTEEGHPGQPCVRTGWVKVFTVNGWRQRHAALDARQLSDSSVDTTEPVTDEAANRGAPRPWWWPVERQTEAVDDDVIEQAARAAWSKWSGSTPEEYGIGPDESIGGAWPAVARVVIEVAAGFLASRRTPPDSGRHTERYELDQATYDEQRAYSHGYQDGSDAGTSLPHDHPLLETQRQDWEAEALARRTPGDTAALEVDDEAGAWYVRILDESVARTTEQPGPVNVDWTRDGRMVGVEVLAPVARPVASGTSEPPQYARIHVKPTPNLDAWPLVERVGGGWQSGEHHYPDADVLDVEALHIAYSASGTSEQPADECHHDLPLGQIVCYSPSCAGAPSNSPEEQK